MLLGVEELKKKISMKIDQRKIENLKHFGHQKNKMVILFFFSPIVISSL